MFISNSFKKGCNGVVTWCAQLNFTCKSQVHSKCYLKQQNYSLFNKADERRRRDWVPGKPQGDPGTSQWDEGGAILNFVRVDFRAMGELGLMQAEGK